MCPSAVSRTSTHAFEEYSSSCDFGPSPTTTSCHDLSDVLRPAGPPLISWIGGCDQTENQPRYMKIAKDSPRRPKRDKKLANIRTAVLVTYEWWIDHNHIPLNLTLMLTMELPGSYCSIGKPQNVLSLGNEPFSASTFEVRYLDIVNAFTPFFSTSSRDAVFQSFSEKTVGFEGGAIMAAQEPVITMRLTFVLVCPNVLFQWL